MADRRDPRLALALLGLLGASACGLQAARIGDPPDRPRASVAVVERPRLIPQITVDQLRGDLPLRYQERSDVARVADKMSTSALIANATSGAVGALRGVV